MALTEVNAETPAVMKAQAVGGRGGAGFGGGVCGAGSDVGGISGIGICG